MKQIIYTLFTCIASIFFFSCSEDYFDVNSSVTAPTTESLEPQYRIKGAIENMFTGIIYRGSREVLGITQYGSQNVANYYSETWSSFLTTGRYFLWQNAYVYSLPNTADLIVLGEKHNSPNFTAVGKILRAYGFGTTTDQYGAIVFNETYDGESSLNLTPEFDDQKTVYQGIATMLDEAIVEINQPSEIALNEDGGDVFYSGNKEQWTRLAYALKARYLNHLSKKSAGDMAYDADAIIEACSKALQSNADNAFRSYGGGEAENDRQPFAVGGYGSSRVDYFSHFFVELLKNSLNLSTTYEDPRLKIIVPEAVNGGYQGVKTGQGPLPDNSTGGDNYSLGNGGYYTSPTSPTYMMTYSEVKYIEAEARFRKGDMAGAYTALKAGVQADFEKASVDSIDTANYIATMDDEVGATGITLSHIMIQKYITLLFDPETWVDMRRMDYSNTIYPGLERPVNVNLSIFPDSNDWIQAMMYEYNEEDRNYENMPDNTPNVRLTTPVWWNVVE
ncbi:SusD/RagB family nutrient-binding outer membrane lipoprotein [uncultured Polaribacter sp.]|uniref:SusD/RagB family nutrient-binding outer membrane lipoprotein n=1 Tax=uncultured Polaribacter sp. TaxID=174711 RepID=UPI0026221893|nr:SusD/RagB family nutrient-binding outer membrane lipoprotein [uncultured Polaribacter sp.]